MTKTRSFLKWAGSKFRCLDKIIPLIPEGQRLIEPFTGSAVVFVNSNYQEYLLGEKNKDLINLFQYVQNEGLSFIQYCAKLFTPSHNTAKTYYQLRDELNKQTDTRYRAALFLYLNRHGYNGLCRYNSNGMFNVPFGRYIKPYFPYDEMVHFHQKSTGVKFIHSDFRHTFGLAESNDVIYCDPPYVPLSKSANFSSYTHNGFSEQDQIELAQLAINSANNGITVIISNHDTPFTRHQYRDSEIISFPVSRNISCQSLNRNPVQELVAIFKN